MGFKVKRNSFVMARLVACRYSQIPGVDFSENCSPVVHNITYHILILLMHIYGYNAKTVGLGQILDGDTEEEIYMKCPPGLKTNGD